MEAYNWNNNSFLLDHTHQEIGRFVMEIVKIYQDMRQSLPILWHTYDGDGVKKFLHFPILPDVG